MTDDDFLRAALERNPDAAATVRSIAGVTRDGMERIAHRLWHRAQVENLAAVVTARVVANLRAGAPKS